jgi:hypothetical protein
MFLLAGHRGLNVVTLDASWGAARRGGTSRGAGGSGGGGGSGGA